MQDEHTIYVVKRDGSKEPLNINNIRKQTIEACDGLEYTSYEELELKARISFYDGITSRHIQEALIRAALDLNGLGQPNYIYVAGRLALYDLYHDIKSIYGRKESGDVYAKVSIQDYFDKFGYTLSDFYKKYSKEEIIYFNSLIVSERDKLFAYPAVKLMLSHYLNRTSKINGKIDKNKKYLIELPQHMFMVIAMFNCQNMKEDRMEAVKELYELLSRQYVIPATPQLANGRIKKGSLASCLITSAADNLESILERAQVVGFGSKIGSGWGIDFSRIRSVSSPIGGESCRSNGKLPLLKHFDSLALYVDQGGKSCASL